MCSQVCFLKEKLKQIKSQSLYSYDILHCSCSNIFNIEYVKCLCNNINIITSIVYYIDIECVVDTIYFNAIP